VSERIQKLLATAGLASRREIERLIGEGRILVNGRPAELGQKVDHDDKIRVDGRPIGLQRKADPTRVLIYKKRVGEVVTREDPEGRRTVFRKLPTLQASRWIAVGRLDINTSGLLLLTNNGELARRLMHPSFEIPREYAVRVHGQVDAELVQRLIRGVELDDGMARFESMRAETHEDGEGSNQWFLVRLREGRNREVRRLFESQGLEVSRLIRVSYGPIALGRGIKSGSSREATPVEVEALMEAVGLEPEQPSKRKPKPAPSGRARKGAADRSASPARKPARNPERMAEREPARKRAEGKPGRKPERKPARKPTARSR
jgi:23S rRNA pseudouridine2605 synthase